jgi:hypothetical protein
MWQLRDNKRPSTCGDHQRLGDEGGTLVDACKPGPVSLLHSAPLTHTW